MCGFSLLLVNYSYVCHMSLKQTPLLLPNLKKTQVNTNDFSRLSNYIALLNKNEGYVLLVHPYPRICERRLTLMQGTVMPI